MDRIFDKKFNQYFRNKKFSEFLKLLINASESVLDIGCGIGDYLKYTNEKQRVVAVEPHAPYIEKAKEAVPWAKFINTDALSYFKNSEEEFDLILLIDVVEHLEENDSFELVKEAKKHCKKIIFSQIPIGKHERHEDIWGLGGEYWQTHRSTWNEEKLRSLGFSYYQIWNNWYDWKETKEKSNDTSVAFYWKAPPISVVIPSYNQSEWLPKTLNSLLAQTYPFWEAVVVDDGSTDETWEIIQKYSALDVRIKGYHKENGGISSALNYGINKSKGKYFCWLSSDDLYYPEKLELQIEAYGKLTEDYGIVFGQFDLIDADDNVTITKQSKPFFDGLEFPQQLKYDIIDGCTVMIPLKILKELNGFNPQFKHAQDTELWFRIAAKGYKFYYIPQKIVKRRVHEQQGFTDFQDDCRLDGYEIVNFYISRYSFIEFYKNVDWNDKDSFATFLSQFFDMISDPDCHINYDILREKFWNWFVKGLKQLPNNIAKQIVQIGVEFFNAKGHWMHKDYFDKFSQLLIYFKTNVNSKNPIKIENIFHDLNKFDRKDSDFAENLFAHAEKFYSASEFEEAISLYKYLADYDNKFTERAFEKFKELCFTFGKYELFVKSFRRKKRITEFDDKTKLLYIWAKIQIRESSDINDIIETIEDEKLKSIAKSYYTKEYDNTEKDNILIWNFEAIFDRIEHYLKIRCDKCDYQNNVALTFDLVEEPTTRNYICFNCFSPYQISDSLMKEYFLSRMSKEDKSLNVSETPSITYIMRYTDRIGGGVNIAFEQIKKLYALGCKIKIYSTSDYPSWTQLPGEFTKVKDHYLIEKIDTDIAIVFSIYDVPKIIDKIHPSRIYHFSQGYEGYHLGNDFETIRMDKYFYYQLHALPVNNIVVSEHLKNLFKEKFHREAYLIPNYINSNIFHPDPDIEKEPYSILFIGNPYFTLKGFGFLVNSIAELAERKNIKQQIQLYVVWGGDEIIPNENQYETTQLKVHFIKKLLQQQVAELMNRNSLFVSCSMYEGFGLPILEAMACGTPVISTRNLGSESFCIDGENCFLVDYNDSQTLGERIFEILFGQTELIEILKNGIITANKFSKKKSDTAFIEVFETIFQKSFPEELKSRFLDYEEVELEQNLLLLDKKLNNFRNKKTANETIQIGNEKEVLTGILSLVEKEDITSAIELIDQAIQSYEKANWETPLEDLVSLRKSLFNTTKEKEKS